VAALTVPASWRCGSARSLASGLAAEESPAGHAPVILRPDQRVRVFSSSTLGSGRLRDGRSGGWTWCRCGMSPVPGLIRRAGHPTPGS
jgi:hypothetical protein